MSTMKVDRDSFQPRMLLLTSLFSGLVAGGALFPQVVLAAGASNACGTQAALASIEAAAGGAMTVVPTLDADVDKCFNPQRPAYITQTHKILNSVQNQYQQSLEQLKQAAGALQNGRSADFVTDASQVVVNINSVNKPVFDQAGNLKNYGFTTSDAKVGGKYRYPNCDSTNNDQPAQNFAKFYSSVVALKQANAALATAVTCVKQAAFTGEQIDLN